MTPVERQLWHRIQRRVRDKAPAVRAAIGRAYRELIRKIPQRQLLDLLRTGSPDRLVTALLNDATLADPMAIVQQATGTTVREAITSFSRDLPRSAARGIGFGVLNPQVTAAINQLETRVISGLSNEIRETVRAFVASGIEDGVSASAMARELREVLPLAPNQLAAVQNFERMLRDGDFEALTRALRDRRFDRTIRKAFAGNGLTEAQIARMTEAYRKRMIAFNANTHAQTIVLESQKLGQRLTWQEAILRGNVDSALLMKRWSGTLDSRERESHLLMEGNTVGWDQPFENGQSYPGEGEYNCRCIALYFTADDPLQSLRPSAGGRGITIEQLRNRQRGAA